MSDSKNVGKGKVPKTFIHFTAKGIAQCKCKCVCVGGQLQSELLREAEVNIVRDICFATNCTCPFVVFLNVQMVKLHSHSVVQGQ